MIENGYIEIGYLTKREISKGYYVPDYVKKIMFITKVIEIDKTLDEIIIYDSKRNYYIKSYDEKTTDVAYARLKELLEKE